MPQHKSAEKRMRTSERRRAYNRMNKSRMKSALKDLRSTTEKAVAEEKYKKVSAILDRLATKGIIHRNTAAHRKSKLAKFIRTLG
ncbi:MAG: 30S ribosomal protein S20 [Bacteroidota bacterium]